jgi:hypothetical protein
MATDTLVNLMKQTRGRMAELLTSGSATRDTALLLADLEEEQAKRDQTDERFLARSRALSGTASSESATLGFMDREVPSGLDYRAGVPRTLRMPTDKERDRGVAIVYSVSNPTFYRAVIERLLPGENFRMETKAHGTYEMTRAEFETALPAMVRSDSYQRGTHSVPGAARYVTGRAPQSIAIYKVD